MTDPSWTDAVTALGVGVTPLAVAGFGWLLNRKWNRDEQKRQKEERLHPSRLDVYKKCLEPFAVALMPDKMWEIGDANKKYRTKDKEQAAMVSLSSIDYRNNTFELMLIGSDEVVRAYNDLFQFFYSDAPRENENAGKEGIAKLGSLLLEIRKSVGEDSTELENWDMLKWLITDIESLQADPAGDA